MKNLPLSQGRRSPATFSAAPASLSLRHRLPARAPLRWWRLSGLLPALWLAGCASMSADGGYADVARLTQERIGQPVQLERDRDSRAQVTALLSQPLTVESAVNVALLNNPGLRAALAELGIAEAELVQAGRLRNPALAFGRVQGGGETEIDRSVSFDIAGLLTMPARRRIEQHRFEQSKLFAATQAVQLAGDTRKTYYTAIAAAQSAEFSEQVAAAAEASAQLAERMNKAGNWSRLDQAREQAFQHDAITQLARTRQEALASREALLRLLGLHNGEGLHLPAHLPELPEQLAEMRDAEARALDSRLDVLAARQASAASAAALGLSQSTGFINVFELAYADKRSAAAPRESGYQVSLELPLFDWGSARQAGAQAAYLQSLSRTAEIAVQARSQVRVAYSAYQSTYQIARHYRDHVVPLRKQIADEVLLRYNGMLASVFELLSDAREQLLSVNGAIEAQRDFWIAETSLQAAIHGGSQELRSQP